VRHVSLLDRALEPLQFLAPLLPQSDKAQQAQMRKLERELGVLDSDDDESTEIDDVEEKAPNPTSTDTQQHAARSKSSSNGNNKKQ
jgi:hypothetical protein